MHIPEGCDMVPVGMGEKYGRHFQVGAAYRVNKKRGVVPRIDDPATSLLCFRKQVAVGLIGTNHQLSDLHAHSLFE